ncbi:GNAT family N-acetyltransferase [Streptomyces sp. NPDC017979]|uniref:GNAT family N-acetyltransferase n=1 Tax=Streptomyces sp. NPDC017979 TaxID=3365024 RepID=UPI0037BBA203
MTQQFTDHQGRAVVVEEITEDNWRDVADVAPADGQRQFVAALAARYLLLSQRGEVWTSLGVRAGDDIVGHVMWAYDDDHDAHWIGGMVVGAAEQGKGVGRATLGAVIEHLSALSGCRQICLSYHPGNTSAGSLYTSFGFQPTGDLEDDEIVMALLVS